MKISEYGRVVRVPILANGGWCYCVNRHCKSCSCKHIFLSLCLFTLNVQYNWVRYLKGNTLQSKI